MGSKIDIPILMRDDSGEVVTVASGVYNADRGTFRFRVDIDTLKGEHFLFGKSMDLGLVLALQIRVIASDLGIEAVVEQQEQLDLEGEEFGDNHVATKEIE